MSILGIDQITYGVEDLDACQQFFNDWGLEQLDNSSDGRLVFASLNGCRVVVADINDAALPAAFEDGPTLREVVWGVESSADLERLRPLLASKEGFSDVAGQPGCIDPNGLAIRFRVSQKHAIDVTGSPSNVWGQHLRVDTPSPIYERARPIEIGHVVLFVADIDAAEAFYAELGFVASDHYPGRGAFMRCAPRRGHHNLFMLQIPSGKQGLNHVAFTVRDIHEVFGGGMHIDRCGWKTQLGPGRHPVSSAYFWYFENPAGALCEYYADEDQLTENWQPRDFTPGPTVFAEWALADGIDGNTRRERNVSVDGQFLTEKRGD